MSVYNTKQIKFIIEQKDSGVTWEDLPKVYRKEFGKKRSMDALRSVYRRYKDKEELEQPKVLILDIETSPILSYVWGLWNNNVGLNQIHTDWHVLSWAAKWLGAPESEVMYEDQRNAKNIEDDSQILKKMWKLLDEAEVVITQNGVKFDIKKLNSRFIMNGFQPPSSFKNIDTLRLAKRHFGFTSNKLEYLTDKLCTKYKKSGHAKFSGFSLWRECLAGNKEAWNEMKEYNILDILSLEELYYKMIPWDSSVNFNLYHDEDIHVCKCGSLEFVKSGFYYTSVGKYQKHKCKKCGAEVRDSKNLLSKEKRKSLKRATVR
jgi:hypothetical protein